MQVITTERLPIKLWLDDIEDGALAQAKNLANLPFTVKHVAIMPDSHQGYGMPIGGVLATEGVVIPNCVGVDIGCFAGETKIPLLDGTQSTIEALTALDAPFWVYSMSANHELVPGKATAIKTRDNAELVRVVISGGADIVCTPDHQFMLNDGSYRETKDLNPYDSLMPLYRSYETRDGYERLTTRAGKSTLTHKMAGEYVYGKQPHGFVFHHINEHQWDNRPENLQPMTTIEHNRLPHARKISRLRTEKFKSERIRALQVNGFYGQQYAQKKKDVAIANITTYMTERPAEFALAVAGNGDRGKGYLVTYNQSERGRARSTEIANRIYPCDICGDEVKSPIGLYNHRRTEHHNHKVISVTPLERRDAVYCLQVEGHHNFALSAGVFVHNCGMRAVQSSLTEITTDQLKAIMGMVRKVIPLGFNHHKEIQDWYGFDDAPDLAVIQRELPSARKQLGTLGGGNHFIEIQAGDNGRIWVMIHSGSRNFGLKTANEYHKLALKLTQRWYSDLPDKDLAFLPLDTQEGLDYLAAMNYCLDFARANRTLMMEHMEDIIQDVTGCLFPDPSIDVHHNYAAMERHFGRNVLVHRKGAIRARAGEVGIIPGSMGANSYITEGLGNADSFMSSSHGAGRRMGRKEAMRTLKLEDEQAKMAGILGAPRGKDDLDEAPGAYKSIDEVMANQDDLTRIIVRLLPLASIKG